MLAFLIFILYIIHFLFFIIYSSSGTDKAAVGAIALSRDVTLAYFERLVSIAHSEVTTNELAYLASEMWRRLTSSNHLN
jgi:hypothetical protein